MLSVHTATCDSDLQNVLGLKRVMRVGVLDEFRTLSGTSASSTLHNRVVTKKGKAMSLSSSPCVAVRRWATS